MFERFQIRSRFVGYDHRFFYLEQSMWKMDGTCASQALYRAAVTDKNGLVSTDKVIAKMKIDVGQIIMPDWVQNWIASEATRPWPPEF